MSHKFEAASAALEGLTHMAKSFEINDLAVFLWVRRRTSRRAVLKPLQTLGFRPRQVRLYI